MGRPKGSKNNREKYERLLKLYIEKKAKNQRFSVSFVANKDNFTTDKCLFLNQKKNYKSIYLLLETKKQ